MQLFLPCNFNQRRSSKGDENVSVGGLHRVDIFY